MGIKAKSERFSAAKVVFEKIVKALESGEIVWSKPWVNGEVPCNAVSKRAYRGYNALYLNFISAWYGYNTPRFVTYNQAKELGGNVKRGEKGHGIVFCDVKITVKEEHGKPVIDDKGKPVYNHPIFISRYYTVFNVDQCENLPEVITAPTEKFATVTVKCAEDIINGYAGHPPISFGGDRAYYAPIADTIQMPHLEHFRNEEGYYSTLFHEMVHSTGHGSRLDRNLEGAKGSESYAQEELIAEIGASILLNSCGMTPQIENSAAYCQSWLKAIKGMKETALMGAFTKAWKATQYIMGEAGEQDGTEDETVAA